MLKYLRRGVIPARIAGIAAQQPFGSKPAPLNQTMPGKCFACVMGATGNKSAGGRVKRADQILISVYQLDYKFAHRFFTRLNNAFRLSLCVTPA